MRVLFVSPRQCWPPQSGAKLRDYHFARALGTCGELSYFYFRDSSAPLVTTSDLPFCRAVTGIAKPQAYSPARIVRGFAGRWPLPVVNYHSRAMAEALAQTAARAKYDLIHLDTTHLAAYAPALRRISPQSQVVFDWHNVESELMRRFAESSSQPLKRRYAHATARRMARLERELLFSEAAHVVCSDRERRDLLAIHPFARVAVIENGVDAAMFNGIAPEFNDPSRRRRLLFVGLMAYHANVDAAVYFSKDLWPSISARFPELRLTLVGADPSPRVLELQSDPTIEVTGTVPDVRPYYQDAFAVVVPLRVGAGTRLKILEAMAAGVPVISTPLGAEGLHAEATKHYLTAQTPSDWISALEQLRLNSYWTALAAAGRTLAVDRYDWSAIGEILLQKYRHWISETASTRPTSLNEH